MLRDKIVVRLRFLLALIRIAVLSVRVLPDALCLFKLRKQHDYKKANPISNALCIRLSKLFMHQMHVHYDVKGRQHIPTGPIVVMANHQSLYDVGLVVVSLERFTSFLAKQQLFHIPMAGYWLRICACFPLKRNNMRKDKNTLDQASQQMVREEKGMVVFPEGTRNRTPEKGFLPFRTGVLRLALSQGMAVLPVVVDGGLHVGKRHYQEGDGWWRVRSSILAPRKTKHIHTASERQAFIRRLSHDMHREWQTIQVQPKGNITPTTTAGQHASTTF